MSASKTVDYRRVGHFDKSVFQTAFTREFAGSPRFSSTAIPSLLQLLGLIDQDTAIGDIRWAAYMLATVMWETTSPTRVLQPALDKKGQPLKDKKGQPVMLKKIKWLMTMAPVDEIGHGKGRKYQDPVKVRKLSDGSVRITEQDGDQFKVSREGKVSTLTKGASMGNVPGQPVAKAYQDDDGTEHAYYGRGYVQLTWWSNYAKAGTTIGLGLDLLLDPEKVKEPRIAYALMSHGMRTGQGFANGRRFSQYFNGAQTDYVGARRMVNGQDHAEDIAVLAEKFEAILLKAATSPAKAGALP